MTDDAPQIDLWGREAPAAAVAAAGKHLAPSQYAILALARRPEGVTASEAGRVLHAQRNGGRGCCAPPPGYEKGPSQAGTDWRGTRSTACCPWMASDGWDAMKRLTARGLVTQDAPRQPYHARVAR